MFVCSLLLALVGWNFRGSLGIINVGTSDASSTSQLLANSTLVVANTGNFTAFTCTGNTDDPAIRWYQRGRLVHSDNFEKPTVLAPSEIEIFLDWLRKLSDHDGGVFPFEEIHQINGSALRQGRLDFFDDYSRLCDWATLLGQFYAHDVPGYCQPTHDGVTCWLPTKIGSTSSMDCPKHLQEVVYFGAVTKFCMNNGTWATADYTKCEPVVTDERHIADEWSLTIEDIQYEDEGEFTCEIRAANGSTFNHTFHLVVMGESQPKPYAPKIEPPLKNQTAEIGQKFRIDCNSTVDKSQQFAVYWLKHYQINGKWAAPNGTVFAHIIETNSYFNLNPSNETMTILRVNVSNEGWYSCLVANHFGHDQKWMWLEVKNRTSSLDQFLHGGSHDILLLIIGGILATLFAIFVFIACLRVTKCWTRKNGAQHQDDKISYQLLRHAFDGT